MKVCLYLKFKTLFLFSVLCLMQVPPAAASDAVQATIVWYLEQEEGISPYRVRYIVTDDYLRMDEGRDDGAFTLFDRHLLQVYSVVPENRSVLQVDGSGEPPVVPPGLVLQVRQESDTQAPRIGGKAPLRIDLVADETVCHSAMVMADLLPPVQATLRAFYQALAVQQKRTLDNTPPEYQTPCFLARYVYASDFHWQRGMVLADWNAGGDRRELVDYELNVAVPESLFAVPPDYYLMPAVGQ